MRSEERERRFVQFIGFIYRQFPCCFKYKHDTWTEEYEKEEGIFAVFIRTLIWNEEKSEQVYSRLGGYERTQEKSLLSSPTDFDCWVNRIVEDVKFGADGRGAHRDNRHKKHTARALREYLDLVEDSQIKFFSEVGSFDTLYHEIKRIHSVGSLTAIDFLERLTRSKHQFVKVHPERFYLTGGGVKRGLSRIYGPLSKKKLEKKGDELLKKILGETNISKQTAYFEIESVLCICQKSILGNDYETMLKGETHPLSFAETYAHILA